MHTDISMCIGNASALPTANLAIEIIVIQRLCAGVRFSFPLTTIDHSNSQESDLPPKEHCE